MTPEEQDAGLAALARQVDFLIRECKAVGADIKAIREDLASLQRMAASRFP